MKAQGSSLWIVLFAVALAAFPARIRAQSLYYLQNGGRPTFTTPEPVEFGFINLANGDLHLEIPLSSAPQRDAMTANARFVYDGRIWQIVNNGISESWQPANLNNFGISAGGWGWIYSDYAQTIQYNEKIQYCNSTNFTEYYGPFSTLSPDGTAKFFPIATQQDYGCGNSNVSTATAYDQHSTGSYASVTDYANAAIYDHSGISIGGMEDTNGNLMSGEWYGGPFVDTLGRAPLSRSCSGSTCTFSVPNSQGSASQYTINYENINVSTNFGVSDVTEYSGTIEVVSSIQLPDGTSYSFSYDSGTTAGHYGELTGITLRTGGQVTYAWSNFSDAYGNVNQWVTSRTSGGGTWTFSPSVISTCTSTQVGCQQKVTETKPSGDQAVYTFTLNNGAWNTETDYYSGSTTLLKKVTTAFDFSNACPDCGGVGAAYIRSTQVNTYLPGAGASQTSYSFDSIYYGNVSAVKQWNYYASGPGPTPDRETDYTYLNSTPYINANILNRVTDKVTYQSGVKEAETATSYDGTALTSITGITQHDDTNHGASNTVRGNPTTVQQWVSGSTYLTTTNYYDTTGQLVKTVDPAGNSTPYGYADSFYNDTGSNSMSTYSPAAPTNAYLTSVTLPVSGTLAYGYYFGTGQRATSTDQNSQASDFYYYDPLSRPTETSPPLVAWTITSYTSATQTDTYRNINSGSPAISCTSCIHTETVLDGWGRVTSNVLASDPVGATTVAGGYDVMGRLTIKSNPYRSTSDKTYGSNFFTYDGLDREISDTHADNTIASTYYGAAVTGGGGIGTQLCSTGAGFPTLAVDEAGHMQETWNDAFGNPVEVDQEDSTGKLTIATCYQHDALNDLTEVIQGGQTRSYAYDGLGRETSETTPEAGTVNTYFTASGGGLCAGSPKSVCRRTDARGITTTYSYDGENRLTSKTYSDSTPPAYYYDESSVSVAGSNYTVTNGKGRMTHTSAASGGAITVDSYDAAGHVADLWQCTPYNCSSGPLWDMHYDYLPGGEVSDYVHPAGYAINYSVANDGRISYIGSSLVYATHPKVLAWIGYAPQGAVYYIENGCVGYGCAQIYEYDFYNRRLQRTQSVLGNSSASPTVACQVYNYYPSVANPSSCNDPTAGTGDDGNVIGHYDYDAVNSSLSHTAAYGYDAMHRLTSAAATGSSTYNLAYTYDQYGNMTCMQNRTTQGLCPQYGFNTATNHINNSGYSYDNAGDLTNDGSHSYQYDAEGRLISVDQGTTASYVYNALGERVEKDVGGTYTEYVFDTDDEPLGENNRTSWTDTWVTFNGQHIAHYQNNETYFIHGDFQGTAGIVTDYTGAVVQDELHYPWGQEWTMMGTQQEERFASLRHRDTETTFDPTQNRTYASEQGRWLSADPVRSCPYHPENFNRYNYVSGNPTNRIDAKGLQFCEPGDPFCDFGCDPFFGCGYGGYGGVFSAFPPNPLSCSEGFGACIQSALYSNSPYDLGFFPCVRVCSGLGGYTEYLCLNDCTTTLAINIGICTDQFVLCLIGLLP